jgi:MFS family permease
MNTDFSRHQDSPEISEPPFSEQVPLRWYQGVTSYQWLVLTIASLGWVFDVFEGQIFVASMRDAMPQLLNASADDPLTAQWNNYALASFLLGGAFGGVFFGMLSDRIGRSRTLVFTILFYSIFTCLTAFVRNASEMVALRFLVAMGVGGEWAVACALVAEVMPKHARAVMSSLFHASSVLGTLLAAAVGAFVISAQVWGTETWRLGFLIGVVPALLTVFIRRSIREPAQWQKAKEQAAISQNLATGSVRELFSPVNLRNTLVCVTLATIGLTTFWGCHIYGKDSLQRSVQQAGGTPAEVKQAEMISMVLNTLGGGLGLILFGAISNRVGRKGAFVLYHAGGFVMAMLLFLVLIPNSAPTLVLCCVLPVFGFLTLGMHAGYAVYFPELFPTRLRGTGTGFGFNMGRIGTAVAMFVAAQMAWKPPQTALYVAPLFAAGVIVSLLGKETCRDELLD